MKHSDVRLEDLVVDDSVNGLFRVHRNAFTDPRIHDLERERIFNRYWIYAAHDSELPRAGSFVARKIAGRDLILTRGPSGEIRALVNSCTHRGARICREASGCAKVFTCPYHGWSFDTAGKLVGLPGDDAYDDSSFDRSERALRTVPRIEIYRGLVFVNLDPKAEPLTEFLAEAKTYIDLVLDQSLTGMEVVTGVHQYTIRANWKLIAENAVDSYHFRFLHKRYIDYVRSMTGPPGVPPGQVPPSGKSLGNGHGMIEHDQVAAFGRFSGRFGILFPEEIKPLVEGNRKKLEEAFGAERAFTISQVNRNVRLFPNLYLNDHNNTSLRTFFPVSAGETMVTEWALAPKDEPPLLREVRLRTYGGLPGPASLVSPDDIEVVELCQEGLMNEEMEWVDCSRGMKRAKPLNTDEMPHRSFYRYWHETLTLGAVQHPEMT